MHLSLSRISAAIFRCCNCSVPLGPLGSDPLFSSPDTTRHEKATKKSADRCGWSPIWAGGHGVRLIHPRLGRRPPRIWKDFLLDYRWMMNITYYILYNIYIYIYYIYIIYNILYNIIYNIIQYLGMSLFRKHRMYGRISWKLLTTRAPVRRGNSGQPSELVAEEDCRARQTSGFALGALPIFCVKERSDSWLRRVPRVLYTHSSLQHRWNRDNKGIYLYI